MPDRLSDKLFEYLMTAQGRKVNLKDIREYLRIEPGSKDDTNLRTLISTTMVNKKIVSPSGYNDGFYKVITQVQQVKVFGRERKPPIDLFFPRDFETMVEFPFAEQIIIREGDVILISGRSNYGKTTLCMNFCAENIDSQPVLMGNEYTTLDGEPSSRFLNRLDKMDWIYWDNDGEDKFTLFPVRDDYAEYVVKDRINIIDWINIETGEYYLISRIMENIKRRLGKGIAIIAIQKAEGAMSGRGGQFTKDFADVEILLDEYGDDEVLLTLGKIKEAKRRLTGKTYAFYIKDGVKIINSRELKQCPECHGKKWKGAHPCENCFQRGYVDA